MTTKQNSENFYQKLKEFDNNKTMNINYVKEILYKFSYCNLEYAFNNAELIRKSVINYLYTGKFELTKDDITEDAKNCLSKILEYVDYDTLNELQQKLSIENQELKECTNDKKKIKIEENIKKTKSAIEEIKIRLSQKVDCDKFYDIIHLNWKKIHFKHEELISKFTNPKNNSILNNGLYIFSLFMPT